MVSDDLVSVHARPPIRYDPKRVIMIGASTGGVDALLAVLEHFANDCPPTLIVQHTKTGYFESLIKLLDCATHANVVAAEHGTRMRSGQIYLAPNDTVHLALNADDMFRINLSKAAPLHRHRPSVDALFASGVPYGPCVAAAILTGMGHDGAQGLADLRRAGALTIGQDASTSVVYGMPKVAFDLGAVTRQLPLSQIGPALLRACSSGGTR